MTSKPSENQPPKAAKAMVSKPDEMENEVVEFISAIDEFKRRNMVKHLPLGSVLEVVRGLGYASGVRSKDDEQRVQKAIDDYRETHSRLFPNWSEVWHVLRELGYQRSA
ncbi:hypothetical protein [Engelhardtia mirabilis]